MLIVISDCLFEDGLSQGLKYLSGGGWDVFLMQTLAPEEIDPEHEGMEGDVRLEDLETGKTCEVTVTSPLIDKYKQRLHSYCEDLRGQCARLGVGSARVSTNIDMESLLVEYLRSRGLLR